MNRRGNRGTDEWKSLSDKEPSKEKLTYCTDEAAQTLLEIMLKDSAYEFEYGVNKYVQAVRNMKYRRRNLELAIKNGHSKERTYDALMKYDEAVKEKRIATIGIKNEYLFLNCERKVKPPIDGMYIMQKIIKDYIADLDEETFAQVKDMIDQARKFEKCHSMSV